MNTQLSILTAVALGVLCTGGNAPQDATLSDQRLQHSDSKYILKTSHEFLLDDLYQQDEGDGPVSMNVSGTLSTDYFVSWRDGFLPGAADQVDFERTYSRVQLTGKSTFSAQGGGTRAEASTFGSHFQGRTVRFTYIPEEQEHSRAYVEVDGPEESLALLRNAGHGVGLLPAGPVAVGDTWPLGSEALVRFIAPLGDLDLMATKEAQTSRSMKVGVGGSLSDTLSGEVFGQGEAKLKEIVTNDAGDSIAVVTLTGVNLAGLSDRTDIFEAMLNERDRKEPAILVGVTIDYQLNSKGELRWNLTKGLLDSSKMDGDERVVLEISKLFIEDERTYTRREVAQYHGRMNFELNCIQE